MLSTPFREDHLSGSSIYAFGGTFLDIVHFGAHEGDNGGGGESLPLANEYVPKIHKNKEKKRIPTFPHEHIRKYPSPEPLYDMPTQMGDGCALKASNE